MDWQPIETAPRGELVLLFYPREYGRNERAPMVRAERHPYPIPRQPTHWCPIPPFPADPPR